MSRTLKILIAVVVVLLVVATVARKKGWIGKQDGLSVTTELTEKRTIIETVSASGKIQPELEVKISPEVSGEIVELNIREGDKVKEGELLVKINQDLYLSAVQRTESALNNAKSALAQSKAQLTQQEASYKRSKTLYEKNVISEAEWDQAKANYEVAVLNVESAEFSVASAEASVKEARDNLARTTIYAPMDGSISALYVEQGERVVGTAQMAGTELLRVADLANMEVVVDVNENDIIRVGLNDTALIEIDAYLDETFKGVVTEIASSAQLIGTSADQVTNFEVKIHILSESYMHLASDKNPIPLRPGMTAAVDIITAVQRDVLTIPIQAVTTRSDTSKDAKSYKVKYSGSDEDDELHEVVFLYNEGEAEIGVVETGIQDDQYIEIKKGLSDSTEVISGPYTVVSSTLINGEDVSKESDSKKKKGKR